MPLSSTAWKRRLRWGLILVGSASALLVFASLAGLLALLLVSTPRSELPAVRDTGREVISALLAGDEARWAALLVPEEAGGVPAALRGYLREYQRLMPGCRGVPVEHAARAVSGGHDGAFFEARFASACVARESQPCDTIGFGMRRIGERWYVATIDRGACDVDLQPAA